MNILVLCTGNSARSILLECLLRHYGTGRVVSFSAGSKPAGQVHPAALSLLHQNGLDTDNLRSKSWDEFATPGAPKMDAVITVCGNARDEECPIWPGAPVRAHWGVEDPAAAPEPEWPTAFQSAYTVLEKRTIAALAQPLEKLSPSDLSKTLNEIGTLQ